MKRYWWGGGGASQREKKGKAPCGQDDVQNDPGLPASYNTVDDKVVSR